MILATVLLGASAFVAAATDPLPLLITVNCGAGIWIASYLTLAQEVSAEHTATAAGLLGGSGSLAGALAMWAVGEVSSRTGSFAIPYYFVAAAGLCALLLAWRWR
jgi:cyanate permease